MRIRLAVVPLALLAGLIATEQAAACSCAGGKPKATFRSADGAVVARLDSVEPGPAARGEAVGLGQAEFHYKLLSVHKGRDRLERGDELVIEGPRSEASCGLPGEEDRRYGLFLERDRGEWLAGLCSVIAPWRMRKAAEERGEGGSRAVSSAAVD